MAAPSCARLFLLAMILSYVLSVLADSSSNATSDDSDDDAFSGDDFMNNLFTDLAPLLGLFGEDFARQFLAESFTVQDRILFAMAPVGIITALVGAIRVGGAEWLKRLVGYARENVADAELEFSSAVSLEVCELWDGKAIVRTSGQPEVKQIIHIPAYEGDISPDSFITMDTAWKPGYELTETGAMTSDGSQDEQPDLETAGVGNPLDALRVKEAAARLLKYEKMPPNLSLNVHRGSNLGELTWYSIELSFYALIATILQAGVLAWSGWIAYSAKAKGSSVLKSSKGNIGFPLLAAGTFLLTLSLILCARIIDHGSTETHWVRNPVVKSDTTSAETNPANSGSGMKFQSQQPSRASALRKKPFGPKDMKLYWVQKQHSTGDKDFDACILFTEKHYQQVLESHRREEILEPKSMAKHKKTLMDRIYNFHQTKDSLKVAISRPTFKTFVAVVIGLLGFVAQFQGLRFLNWSCAIGQLIAVGISTFLRGLIRRGMNKVQESVTVDDDHLLDHLTMSIVGGDPDNDTDFPCRDSLSSPGLALALGVSHAPTLRKTLQPRINHEGQSQTSSTIDGGTGPKAEDPNSQPTLAVNATTAIAKSSLAQKALALRMRLSFLTKWTSAKSEEVIVLSESIETALRMLSPELGEFGEACSLVLPIFIARSRRDAPDSSASGPQAAPATFRDTPSLTGQVWDQEEIELSLVKNGDQWEVFDTELEALLSLLLYSVHMADEETNRKAKTATVDNMGRPASVRRRPLEKNTQRSKARGWLRAKILEPVFTFDIVVGKSNDRLLSDLFWWIEDAEKILKKIKVTKTRDPANFSILDQTASFYTDDFNSLPANIPGLGFYGAEPVDQNPRDEKEENTDNSPEDNDTFWALQVECSERQFFSLSIFSSFMWAVTKYISVSQLHPTSVSRCSRKGSSLFPRDSGCDWFLFRPSDRFSDLKLPQLTSEKIDAVAQELVRIGQGNSKELYKILIPALSHFDKLPNEALVDWYHDYLVEPESNFYWGSVFSGYTSLLRAVDQRKTLDRFAFRAAAVSVEFLVRVTEEPINDDLKPDPTEGLISSTFVGNEILENFRKFIADRKLVLEAILSLKSVLPEQRWREQPRNGNNIIAINLCIGLDQSQLELPKAASVAKNLSFPNGTNVFGWTKGYTYAFELGMVDGDSAYLRNILDSGGQSVLHHIIDYIGRSPKDSRYAKQTRRFWEDRALFKNCGKYPPAVRTGQTLLHRAAKLGVNFVVLRLLEEGANPNAVDFLGRTALCLAARHGHYEIVVGLIHATEPFSLIRRDKYRRNVLHLAILNIQENPSEGPGPDSTQVKIVELLLACADIDANFPDFLDRTPLSYAAETCGREILYLFLGKSGVNVNFADYRSRTPIWHAAKAGNARSVEFLLQDQTTWSVDTETRGWSRYDDTKRQDHDTLTTPEEEAALQGHRDVVSAFRKYHRGLHFRPRARPYLVI